MMASSSESMAYFMPEMSNREALRLKGLLNEGNKWTFSELLPHPFHETSSGNGASPLTLLELRMMELSRVIRSREGWSDSRKDPAALAGWKEEAQKLGLTEKQFNLVVAELDYYVALKTGAIEPSVVDGVWQAEGLVPSDLKESLLREVAKFENIPGSEQDWNPGPHKQVLNLLDPSLFCLVYGVTRTLEKPAVPPLDFIGAGEVVCLPEESSDLKSSWSSYKMSRKYQLLPTDFWVSDKGDVEIKSYINNLHPLKHAKLTTVLAGIFEECVPLLNKTLSFLMDGHPRRVEVKSGVDLDASVFKMPDDISENMSVDLSGRNLQVVTKLGNIALTPDNPTYPGGSWHVAGMLNEHIVATVIYYFDSDNITEPRVHYRQAVREPHDSHLREIYGLAGGTPLVQGLGSIVTRMDQCIAFPNVFQHMSAPFELRDKTKAGYRKSLVFFLIDPAVRVPSTLNIPPQQKPWFLAELQNMEPFDKLPLKVLEKIVEYLPWPMSLGEARFHREKMNLDRKVCISENTKKYFEKPYSV